MKNYSFGDVLLANFPQLAVPGPKVRPVVVILKSASLQTVGRLTALDRRRVAEGWRSLYDLEP